MNIASAPNCQVGSWIQQWNCGWNANKTGAHVDMNPFTSHGGSPHVTGLLIGVAIALIIIAMIRKGSGRSAAASR